MIDFCFTFLVRFVVVLYGGRVRCAWKNLCSMTLGWHKPQATALYVFSIDKYVSSFMTVCVSMSFE